MIFNSIRWRLQAWHGLILVAVLAGFGLTAYQVARDNQSRRIDQDLGQHLMMVFRPEPPGPPPGERPGVRPQDRPGSDGDPEGRREGHPGPDHHPDPFEFRRKLVESVERAGSLQASQSNAVYFVLWENDGTVLARSADAPKDVPHPPRFGPRPPQAGQAEDRPAPSRPGPPMFPVARTRGDLREMFRSFPHGECLLVGRSLAPDLAAMRRLALWLVAAGAAVLLLGLAGGWWVATRAIRPIEDISATALKITGGDLSQRINAADTESELGRLAAVLNSTFARLEAAFAHQSRFTADASHELRTPVAVILSQTQTALSRERSATEYRDALAACQRAAVRMRQLTESLLELARLDAGQQPMKRQLFDLARVARECVDLIGPLAVERAIDLKCDLPSVECLGDPERVGQVATNLLSNAIYFNRPHGEVRISTAFDNGAPSLSVTDTGQGIPSEDLPHIFERFYRVDKARSGIQGRTGLGLAICKAIMDAHSASIEVSSQPGTGSTFTLRFPTR